MELNKFLRLLRNRKFILIIVPVITVIITYFLVRHSPDQYLSRARIATGMADPSQQLIDKQDAPESEVNQKFTNLIQMMSLNKMIDQVAYQLIIHDLTDSKPFREPSKLMKTVDASARKHAIEVYTSKYTSMDELALWDKDQYNLNELLKSMRYDADDITSKLSVYRLNNSDFINVEFASDNPDLSAFVVNTLCKEFITYYTNLVKENQRKAVNFLAELLKQKQEKMDSITNALKNYKIQNHVLNLNEEAKSVYGQIADFETKRGVAIKDIAAYQAALNDIDKKFDPSERKYVESSLTQINQSITNTRDQLNNMNDAYVKSGFDETYLPRIDSLRNKLGSEINQSSDKYILNPLSTKKELISQKLLMEVQLDLSTNSLNSLQAELERLNAKFNGLVPHEAVVQSFENNFDVASHEYLEVLVKFNQTSMVSNFSVQLRQIEMAMPEPAQPSKKMLLVILSGIISFVFCIVVLFVLFYLDNSLQTPKELANKTNIPVVGFLNTLRQSTVDFKSLWNDDSSKELIRFKNLLRAIRFEVEKEMLVSKMLVITSVRNGEGKTFLATSLAYAFAMVNKKVILIDGDLSNASLTKSTNASVLLEDYFSQKSNHVFTDNISVIGNGKSNRSLLEVVTENNVAEKIEALKQQADIVIVDASGLNTLNKAKEWIQYADKVVAVFKANHTINEVDNNHIEYLKSLDEKFIGWVLNKVTDENVNHLMKV